MATLGGASRRAERLRLPGYGRSARVPARSRLRFSHRRSPVTLLWCVTDAPCRTLLARPPARPFRVLSKASALRRAAASSPCRHHAMKPRDDRG